MVQAVRAVMNLFGEQESDYVRCMFQLHRPAAEGVRVMREVCGRIAFEATTILRTADYFGFSIGLPPQG
jgi:hypothetical protein